MRPPTQTQVVNALAKERLLPFLMLVFAHLNPGKPPLKPSWYLRAMCYWLERVAAGQLLTSMIWIQPRALKSITCAVAFPCWLLGRNPSEEVMVATYGGDLARQHADHRRSVFESDWYRKLFPSTRIAPRGNRQEELITTRNGRCLSVSVGGRATGSGANFIILDDVMKADEAQSEATRFTIKSWFDTTLMQRLNPFGSGAIVSIQQRVHEDDLPAYLRDKGYDCLCLPAIAPRDMEIAIGQGRTHLYRRNDILCPELMSREKLEAKRIQSGPQVFSAQFLQDPVAPEGNLIRLDQFRRYEVLIERERFDKVFQSWDTAASALPTADWSVCTTWGYLAGRYFLLDIYRARVEYPDLKRAVIMLKHRFRADRVLIEDANSGTGIIQELRKSGPFSPVACKPTNRKEDRLLAQTGQIEEGRVYLPATLPNLDYFLGELRAFPFGTHDDCVDSLSQMLEYALVKWRDTETKYAPNGRRKEILRQAKRPPLPPLPEWII
jgi:predicted phage terminase large subunit-like protein